MSVVVPTVSWLFERGAFIVDGVVGWILLVARSKHLLAQKKAKAELDLKISASDLHANGLTASRFVFDR
jgi:hypothetical protein